MFPQTLIPTSTTISQALFGAKSSKPVAASPAKPAQSMRLRRKRVLTQLKTRVAGGTYDFEAEIKNLSLGGCFISAQDKVAMGDTVIIEIGIPKLLYMFLVGQVVRREQGVGFALKFRKLSVTEEQLLMRALKDLQCRPRTPARS